MIPKEKAKELYNKMYLADDIKKCTLIAVDEMLNEYPSQCPKDSYDMEKHIYWNEVKQEIEKL